MGDNPSGMILPLMAFAVGVANPRGAEESARSIDLLLQQQRHEANRATQQAQFQQQFGLQQAAGQRDERSLASRLAERQAQIDAGNAFANLPLSAPQSAEIPAIGGTPSDVAEYYTGPVSRGIPAMPLGTTNVPLTADEARAKIAEMGGLSPEARSNAIQNIISSSRFPSVSPDMERQQRVLGAIQVRDTLIGNGTAPQAAQNIAGMVANQVPMANEFVQEALKPNTVTHATGSHLITLDRRTGQPTGQIMLLPQAPKDSVSLVVGPQGNITAVGLAFDPNTGTFSKPVTMPITGVTSHLAAGADVMGGMTGPAVTTALTALASSQNEAQARLIQAKLPGTALLRELPAADAARMALQMLEVQRQINPMNQLIGQILTPQGRWYAPAGPVTPQGAAKEGPVVAPRTAAPRGLTGVTIRKLPEPMGAPQ